jgi:hypothetical protein
MIPGTARALSVRHWPFRRAPGSQAHSERWRLEVPFAERRKQHAVQRAAAPIARLLILRESQSQEPIVGL